MLRAHPTHALPPRPCGPPFPSLSDFHWLPTADMLGDSPAQVAVNLLAVLPVISLSFVCQ
jgi:hypothetical protein